MYSKKKTIEIYYCKNLKLSDLTNLPNFMILDTRSIIVLK